METKVGHPVKLPQPHDSQLYDSVELAVKAGFTEAKATPLWKVKEISFFVAQKLYYTPPSSSEVRYCYTPPEKYGDNVVRQFLPVGYLMVCAFCHTHPQSTNVGNFSPGDKRGFLKLRKVRPGIAWYLLNPQGQI